uniref:LRAT domain-containing protein n=1 Tax=Macrostomum lignano TaxID=282301 RepID=A0A1I8JNV2_9PLAT
HWWFNFCACGGYGGSNWCPLCLFVFSSVYSANCFDSSQQQQKQWSYCTPRPNADLAADDRSDDGLASEDDEDELMLGYWQRHRLPDTVAALRDLFKGQLSSGRSRQPFQMVKPSCRFPNSVELRLRRRCDPASRHFPRRQGPLQVATLRNHSATFGSIVVHSTVRENNDIRPSLASLMPAVPSFLQSSSSAGREPSAWIDTPSGQLYSSPAHGAPSVPLSSLTPSIGVVAIRPPITLVALLWSTSSLAQLSSPSHGIQTVDPYIILLSTIASWTSSSTRFLFLDTFPRCRQDDLPRTGFHACNAATVESVLSASFINLFSERLPIGLLPIPADNPPSFGFGISTASLHHYRKMHPLHSAPAASQQRVPWKDGVRVRSPQLRFLYQRNVHHLLLQQVYDIDELTTGCQVAFRRSLGYYHHAIVADVGAEFFDSIEYDFQLRRGGGSSGDGGGRTCVRRRSREFKREQPSLYRVDYHSLDCYEPDIVVDRANRRLNETQYSLIRSNCEHLAVWAKTGAWESYQLRQLEQKLTRSGGESQSVRVEPILIRDPEQEEAGERTRSNRPL